MIALLSFSWSDFPGPTRARRRTLQYVARIAQSSFKVTIACRKSPPHLFPKT